MNETLQTINTGEYGNCLEACLASLFEEDINNYPKIATGLKWPKWLEPINTYLLETHGCYLMCLETDTPRKDFWGYYIVVGENKGASHTHAMIGLNGKIVFDPSGDKKPKYEKYKYLILVKYFMI